MIINCRDLVTPLRQLVAWLERAGHEEIYLLDNDSAYEPLLEYYKETPHQVIRLGKNYGKNALWLAPEGEALIRKRRFVYTDPDIVPIEECPLDAVERFSDLLDRYLRVNKAGFGLKCDDIPATYRHRDAAIAWEQQLWTWPLGRNVFFAPHDTAFCLYRVGAPRTPTEAIRTGFPYMARHTAYYIDFDNPTPEEEFYSTRAVQSTSDSEETSHWSLPDLPPFNAIRGPSKVSLVKRLDTRIRWRFGGRRAVRLPAPWSVQG